MNSERRLVPRYRVALDVEIAGTRGRTVDVSSEGVYLEAAAALTPGQEVRLILQLDHAAPAGTRVECTARVLRVEPREGGYGVAAAYEAIAFEIPRADFRRASQPDSV